MRRVAAAVSGIAAHGMAVRTARNRNAHGGIQCEALRCTGTGCCVFTGSGCTASVSHHVSTEVVCCRMVQCCGHTGCRVSSCDRANSMAVARYFSKYQCVACFASGCSGSIGRTARQKELILDTLPPTETEDRCGIRSNGRDVDGADGIGFLQTAASAAD